MVNSGVYQIQHLHTGMRYVGSTVNLHKRKVAHFSTLRRDDHSSRHLQALWNESSQEDFEFSVLFHCAPKECLLWEQHFMDEMHPELNVSLRAEGPAGITHPPRTEAQRDLYRQISKGNWEDPALREKNTKAIQASMTPEECEKRSERTIKLWADPVYRQNAINARLGKATNKGYKCTPEQTENRRKAAKISNMKRRARKHGTDWRDEYVAFYGSLEGIDG